MPLLAVAPPYKKFIPGQGLPDVPKEGVLLAQEQIDAIQAIADAADNPNLRLIGYVYEPSEDETLASKAYIEERFIAIDSGLTEQYGTITEAVETATGAATAADISEANAASAEANATAKAAAAEVARAAAVVARAGAEAAAGSIQRGEADGVAPLDGDVRVPQINLPEHLDPDELATTFDPKLDLYVEDFAAPGFTWGTDDTAPWQATLDAAHTAGLPARIIAKPGRVYKINPLKVYSKTYIDLNGATLQPRVRVGGSNIWDALIYTAGCVAANGCTGDGVTVVTDVTISNGTLDTLSRCYAGVMVQLANNVRVLNCNFPSVQDKQGISFARDTSDCVAEDNRITMTLDSPFGTIVNAQGINCSSLTVDGTAGAYGSYGTATVDTVAFTQPTNLSKNHRIANNHIHNGTHAIALWGADSCVIEGNTITNPSHRGVILSPCSHRNVIDGNHVSGTFSCAFLLAFGSRFNVVSNNIAYCTDSQSEFNAFRASFGASDNLFVGNYAYGVTGAAFRAMIGAINNSFIGNKAEACGSGIEFRSLNTDSGYPQNINTPAMTGNLAQGNDFLGCTYGIRLQSASTTAAGTTTPPTTAGVPIPLNNCALVGNRMRNSGTNAALFFEEVAGTWADGNGISAITAVANACSGSGSTDWQTGRANSHFTMFVGNNGSGVPTIMRAPAAGNTLEVRHLTTDAMLAFIGQSGAIVTTNRRAAGASVASTLAIDYIGTSGVGNIGLRIDGSAGQTADLQQWTINLGPSTSGSPHARVDKGGRFITAAHSAPADADLANGEMALWFDQTNGAAKLMIKAKEQGGTVRTASVALA